MRWEKLGRVFVANGQADWMRTHAAWPRAVHLRDGRFRAYFSTRDAHRRSHIGFVDFDVRHPGKILALSSRPVLSPGPIGRFDDAGVIPCGVTRLGDRMGFYYAGVSLTGDDRFVCYPGLAYLDASLRRATRALRVPVIDRTESEPYSLGAVCVGRGPDRKKLHMWYESCDGWTRRPRLMPRFSIRHATSRDGLRWNRSDTVAIDDARARSYVSNPSVILHDGLFRMWYSYKIRDRYRIGYAESRDGRRWTRRDSRAGIRPSGRGWDSDDVAYPSVFHHHNDLFMLYNGNGYGRTGFGLARLVRTDPS